MFCLLTGNETTLAIERDDSLSTLRFSVTDGNRRAVQFGLAKKCFEEAVTTYEQLTAKNPRSFEIDLCGSMSVLGYIHFQLLVKTKDLTHLEKADSLLTSAINRLKKYPEVPRAIQLLNMAQEIKQIIDEAKGNTEKTPR